MNESEVRDLIDQAVAALNNGDYVRAVGIGDQLASVAPDRAVVSAIRAQALLGADAPDESFDEARRAVELAPSDHHAHQLLAMAAWRTGRLRVAQEAFQQAIALSGRRPALLSEYAWFMATERGPKLGEQAASEAVDADAESSTAWAALGLAQFRLHRRNDAESSLQQALRLNPNDIYAQSAMVTLLQDQHEDGKAEALAGLLEEHAGAEELVVAVRREAKLRRVERMLVERKVDPDEVSTEPRTFSWMWLLIGVAVIAPLLYLIDPWLSLAVVVLTIVLLVTLRRWLD